MKVSFNWLNEYIDLSDYRGKIHSLASILTNAGLEVEEIEDQALLYDSIVVGSILEKKQHPDADRLTVCQVSVGEGVVQQIVCGAKNHKENDKVVVALPGSSLPNGLNIQNTTLRGVESSGMLCSEKELGLSEESSGIMILNEDAKVGEAFSSYQNLQDVFFELKVTPNRADCLSHVGLARELASLLGREMNLPKVNSGMWQAKLDASLEVENLDLCPRYACRTIHNVKVAPSPAWLKQRLEALGLNSINNVVDITNFVMLEYGQPLHAFDLAFLEQNKVRVATAKAGETFTSLDATEYKLDGSELMIYDGKKPVALAGVVGGLNSGVREETTDLFIECAYFVPQTVRKTARKFGIETDAAYRFSRGVDPANIQTVLDRTCALIAEYAHGEVSGDFVDIYPNPIQTANIPVKLDFVEQKLGYSIAADSWEKTLEALNCHWRKDGEQYIVKAPLYRHDISIKEDLVEEYARVRGYDDVPEHMPNARGAPKQQSDIFERARKVREHLSHDGLMEAMNYAFSSSTFERTFLGNKDALVAAGLEFSAEPVKIQNPLSEEYDIMRTSLVPGLYKNLLHNYRRGQSHGQIFEIGFCFQKQQNDYEQRQRLALISWGEKQNLWQSDKAPNVLKLKNKVERLLYYLGLRGFAWDTSKPAPDFLHSGQFAYLKLGEDYLGYIGSLHPRWSDKDKIRSSVALAEFSLDSFSRHKKTLDKVQPLNPFPAVERDLVFIVDQLLAAGDLQNYILDHFSKVKKIEVFDLYQGDNLEKGKKSLGFRMKIEDHTKTLSEKELTSLQEEIITGVQEKFGATLR